MMNRFRHLKNDILDALIRFLDEVDAKPLFEFGSGGDDADWIAAAGMPLRVFHTNGTISTHYPDKVASNGKVTDIQWNLDLTESRLPLSPLSDEDYKLADLYHRTVAWTKKTFPRQNVASILKHMRKEFEEHMANPGDVEELADMCLLAMALAYRGPAVRFAPGSERPVLSFDKKFSSKEMGVSTPDFEVFDIRRRIAAYENGCPIHLPEFVYACFVLHSRTNEHVTLGIFLERIEDKLITNQNRSWPSPEQQVPGEPIEHIKPVVGKVAELIAHNSQRKVLLGPLKPGEMVKESVTVEALVLAWHELKEFQRMNRTVHVDANGVRRICWERTEYPPTRYDHLRYSDSYEP